MIASFAIYHQTKMAEDGGTNAYIHFVDERDLLTTELSDYNDLCFETCILEGTSYVTDRILYRMANGRL